MKLRKINWNFLGSIFVLVISPTFSMYCEPNNCYDVLQVTREATKSEIQKAYRKLAKEFHPDKHKTEDAKKEFAKKFTDIATAYELLKDEDARKEYDYMLDHPDEYYRNYYNYYRRRLSPKVDVRIVIIVSIAIISLIQYFTSLQKYNEALSHFLTIPKYRIKAKEIAESKGLLSTLAANKRHRKMNKEDIKNEEEYILKKIIEEQLDVKGAYAKPMWTDVIAIKIVLLPYTLSTYVKWYCLWLWKFRYQGEEYGDEEKLYLIRRNMEMSQAQFDQHDEWEKQKFLDDELWIKEKCVAWKKDKEAESKAKLIESGKYKNYRRWMKRGGPGQITFADDD